MLGVLISSTPEASSQGIVISTDTVWTAANSPYYLEGNLTIEDGAKLTLEAGVAVYINGTYNIYVDGGLYILGTPSQPVTLTSNSTTRNRGDWGNLQVNSTGTIWASNFHMSYATTLRIEGDNCHIENATITESGDHGIYFGNCLNGTIANSSVYRGNNIGVYLFQATNVSVHNTLINHTNSYGIYTETSAWTNLTKLTIHNTSSYGIYIYDGDHIMMDDLDIEYTNGYNIRVQSSQFINMTDLVLWCGSDCIYMDSDTWIFVQNVIVRYTSNRGIRLSNSHNTEFQNIIYHDQFGRGFEASSCNFLTVNNSKGNFPTWDYPYYFYNCYKPRIENITLTCQPSYTIDSGLYLDRCRLMVIKNNSIDVSYSHFYFYSATTNEDYFKHTIQDNTAGGKPVLYYEHQTDLELDDPDSYHLIFYRCYNVNLTNYHRSFGDTIDIWFCDSFNLTNVNNSETRWGFGIYNSKKITLDHCSGYTNYNYGFWSYYNEQLNITNCKFENTHNYAGYIERDWGFTIQNTTFAGRDYGLRVYYSRLGTVKNNIFGGGRYYNFQIWGNSEQDYDHIFFNNTDNGLALKYHFKEENISYIDTELGYLGAFYCVNVSVINSPGRDNYQFDQTDHLEIHDIHKDWGVDRDLVTFYINQGRWVNISGINITDSNWNCFEIYNTWYMNISHSEFYDSSALYLSSCWFTYVFNNTWSNCNSWAITSYSNGMSEIYNNRVYDVNYGFYLNNFDDSRAYSNILRVMDNGNGFQLQNCDHSFFEQNSVEYASGIGFELQSCTYLNITNNYVNNSNNYGIYLNNCDWNRISQNWILNNNNQARDDRATNLWYNTTYQRGNLWSDYSAIYVPPATNNGIYWDTPYEIDADSKDMYPLVDVFPPTITCVYPGNNSYVFPPDAIQFSIQDFNYKNSTIRIDGIFHGDFPAPFNVGTTGWTEGVHWIQIYANDTDGNEVAKDFYFYVDTVVPMVNFVTPGNNSVVKGDTELDFEVSDANLDSVIYQVDNGPWKPFSAPYNISLNVSWGAGLHLIRVGVTDKAGNGFTYVFFVTIDNSKPVIELISPEDGATINAGGIIDISITDDNLLYAEYSINGDPFLNFPAPFDLDTSLLTGGITLDVVAEDKAGNIDQKSYMFTIEDTSKPRIVLLSPKENSIISPGTDIVLYVSDNAVGPVTYKLNSGPINDLPPPWVIDTSDWTHGPYVVSASASDLSGNTAQAEFTFFVDQQSPTIKLLSPANGSYLTREAQLIFSITDDQIVSKAQYRLNDWPLETMPNGYVLLTETFKEGRNTLTILAEDSMGNKKTSTYEFVIDTVKPEILLDSLKNGQTIAKGVNVVVHIYDVNFDHATVAENDGLAGSVSTPITVSTSNWSEGRNYLEVVAVDKAGNIETRGFFFEIDATKPRVLATEPKDGASGVSLSRHIYLDFSEHMYASKTFEGITIEPNIGWTPHWVSTTQLEITPSRDWDLNQTYTVTVTGLKDKVGNDIETYTFSFTTLEELITPNVSPKDNTIPDRPDLTDTDDAKDRDSSKREKNMTWVAFLALALAIILVVVILFKMNQKWQKEDELADKAMWDSKHHKPEHKKEIADETDTDDEDMGHDIVTDEDDLEDPDDDPDGLEPPEDSEEPDLTPPNGKPATAEVDAPPETPGLAGDERMALPPAMNTEEDLPDIDDGPAVDDSDALEEDGPDDGLRAPPPSLDEGGD